MAKLQILLIVLLGYVTCIADANLKRRVGFLEDELMKETNARKRAIHKLEDMISNLNSTEESLQDSDEQSVMFSEDIKMEIKELAELLLDEQRQKMAYLSTGFHNEKQISRNMLHDLSERISSNNNETSTYIDQEIQKIYERIEHEEKERKKQHDEIMSEMRNMMKRFEEMGSELNSTINNIDLMKVNPIGTRTSCPDKWTRVMNKCYLYRKDALSWNGAEVACFVEGGVIAQPETEEEMRAVGKLVGNDVWIGGILSAETNQWVWTTEQKPINFFLWEDGQPNNLNGNQNCMEFFSGLLNDENCSQQNKFICEMKLPV